MSDEAAPAPPRPRIRVGRPRLIESPEEFQRLADEYVAICDAEDRPLLLTGLCAHLGMDCDTLREYVARPEFSGVAMAARLAVAESYEYRLATGDRMPHVVGAIFALKNVAGWTDRREVEYRGLIGRLDLDRLTDEQLSRVARGEHPLAVLAESVPRQLPPGEPIEPMTPPEAEPAE